MVIKRREFLKKALTAGFALTAVAATQACPSDDDDATVVCTVADANGVADSHNHTILVPMADINAGTGGTYTSTGGHTHDVTLTAGDMATLAATCFVQTSASNGTHTHTWDITIPA